MPASYHAGTAPIPSIAIIPDSTNNVLDVEEHDPDSDNALLSPRSLFARPRSPLEVPPSPTPTDASNDGSSMTIPPSPTLSNASLFVHFQTSLALRDNKPENHSHSRKPSNATFNSESTQPEHQLSSCDTDLAQRRTINSDVTTVVGDREKEGSSQSPQIKSKKSKKDGGEEEEPKQTTHQAELAQDRDMDPAPFILKPYELAHMLDPKNTDVLSRVGGTQGFLSGLAFRNTRWKLLRGRRRIT